MGENINAVKYSTEPLIQDSREVGLEAITQKTKYMVVSRHQNSGQGHKLLTANKSVETVAKLKYLGTTGTNQNCIHEEIKNELSSGNSCSHSVRNILSSRFISKNLKIKI
jgi:hypothetical protein